MITKLIRCYVRRVRRLRREIAQNDAREALARAIRYYADEHRLYDDGKEQEEKAVAQVIVWRASLEDEEYRGEHDGKPEV